MIESIRPSKYYAKGRPLWPWLGMERGSLARSEMSTVRRSWMPFTFLCCCTRRRQRKRMTMTESSREERIVGACSDRNIPRCCLIAMTQTLWPLSTTKVRFLPLQHLSFFPPPLFANPLRSRVVSVLSSLIAGTVHTADPNINTNLSSSAGNPSRRPCMAIWHRVRGLTLLPCDAEASLSSPPRLLCRGVEKDGSERG